MNVLALSKDLEIHILQKGCEELHILSFDIALMQLQVITNTNKKFVEIVPACRALLDYNLCQ